jgi:Uma2 family endonuclease
MQLSTTTRITPEQFFAWISGQEERYELVDGEVVMTAGAGRRPDRIVVNLTTAIHSQIRGGACQTFTGDTYVATNVSTRRMPDLGVDCGKPDDDFLTADKRSLVVEVLSPTTGGFDVTVKLAEYQSLPSLNYILFVDTDSPNVHLYWRDDDGLWKDVVPKGLRRSLGRSGKTERPTRATGNLPRIGIWTETEACRPSLRDRRTDRRLSPKMNLPCAARRRIGHRRNPPYSLSHGVTGS